MKRLADFLVKPIPGLVFSLFCGVNYFVPALAFIMHNTAVGGWVLGLFLFPMITAGCALVILKVLKRLCSEERNKAVFALLAAHIVFFAVNIVFIADMLAK